MKKYLITICLSLLFVSFAISQELSQNKEGIKALSFILNKKLDSARIYVKKIEDESFSTLLNKIIEKEKVSLKEYNRFFSIVGNQATIDYLEVSKYIDRVVTAPTSKNIEETYFNIKWKQIKKLRDIGLLEEASKKQKVLENYVANFSESDVKVQKARLKLTTHTIVLYQLENDIENSKKLILKSLEASKKLKDIELKIIFLYHLSDIFVLERKLQQYIDASEESLALENQLSQKTPYYFATLEHLIDAYIYKGGFGNRVNTLIEKMYANDFVRSRTYTFYLHLIFYGDASVKKEVLNKFNVSNVKELVAKFKVLAKDLSPNDFSHFLKSGAKILQKYDYFYEAITLKDEEIALNKKIYSEDLSNALANFKTAQAIKQKDKEILHEKEKTNLYFIITVLAVVFLLICLIIIRKIKNQSIILSEKNKIINKTLKEKDLLVKEVHHRVKNNFQIVSSLLELQSKGIQDEKALQLANDTKNRIKSMALIHQKLYKNDAGLVDFDKYIHLLIKELSLLYAEANTVTTKISSKNIMLDVDTAVPLGLIINEIITNSFKYAFGKEKELQLTVVIRKNINQDYQLVIEDNGPGISKNIDIKNSKSLGLRLVNRLVKQLHGKLLQTNNNGARFEISFKDNIARKLIY